MGVPIRFLNIFPTLGLLLVMGLLPAASPSADNPALRKATVGDERARVLAQARRDSKATRSKSSAGTTSLAAMRTSWKSSAQTAGTASAAKA